MNELNKYTKIWAPKLGKQVILAPENKVKATPNSLIIFFLV